MVSIFNNLKFNKKDGNSYENNSFEQNTDKLCVKSRYVNEYLNSLETILVDENFSGSYGFKSVSEFGPSSGLTNPRIVNCKYCFDSGSVIYSNLDNATIGRFVTLKFEGNITQIQIRENGTIIQTFTNSESLFKHVLTQDYTNLNLKITGTDVCIIAAMVVDETMGYKICGLELEANLHDVTPYGGAYSINIDDVIRKEITTFDFSSITTQNITIKVVFDDLTFIEETFLTPPLPLTNYYYLELISNLLDNYYNELDFFTNQITTIGKGIKNFQITDGILLKRFTPFTLDEKYIRCCQVETDNYISEPFTIVSETNKREIVYWENDYRQNLIAGFKYKIYIESNIRRIAQEEGNLFNGQQRSYNLGGVVFHSREFSTIENIPDYLSEILEGVFNAQNIEIDGVAYTKTEKPSWDFLDDKTLWTNFEVKLRLNFS